LSKTGLTSPALFTKIAEGVVGLGDEPRPGAPREIGDEKVEQVVRLTLEQTPKGLRTGPAACWQP
jgi:hypothetical protein